MVLLTTTPQILQILSSLPPAALSSLAPASNKSPTATNSTEADSPDNTNSLPTTLTSPISHQTLIALSRLRHQPLRNDAFHIPSLNTLLRGTKPYRAPPPPKPTPTPEYTALMARLREEQEQRDYAALVAKQHRVSLFADTAAEAQDQDNISPSLVLNILLSVVMCAMAVFQMTKWYANGGVRVLMSLGTGLVVGVAEVGVYSIYLMKVRQAKEREMRKKERKSLIGDFVSLEQEEEGNGDEKGGVRIVEGKEEIWGRGVNGGMRRRVREKWEKEQKSEE